MGAPLCGVVYVHGFCVGARSGFYMAPDELGGYSKVAVIRLCGMACGEEMKPALVELIKSI